MRVEQHHYRESKRDQRRERRFFRRGRGSGLAVEEAFNEGQFVAEYGPHKMPFRYRTNPYPPGRRHDAFEQGMRTHGRGS